MHVWVRRRTPENRKVELRGLHSVFGKCSETLRSPLNAIITKKRGSNRGSNRFPESFRATELTEKVRSWGVDPDAVARSWAMRHVSAGWSGVVAEHCGEVLGHRPGSITCVGQHAVGGAVRKACRAESRSDAQRCS